MQIIERLWRDVKENADLSYNTFEDLEMQVKKYEFEHNMGVCNFYSKFLKYVELVNLF